MFSTVLSGRNVCSANKKEGVRDESTEMLLPFASLFPSGCHGTSQGQIHLLELGKAWASYNWFQSFLQEVISGLLLFISSLRRPIRFMKKLLV